jgi:hypothetical protein
LKEYGYPFLPMNAYNGTLVDSNRTEMTVWRMLYASFLTSYVGTGVPTLPALSAVNTTIANKQTSSGAIPISLLHANYNDLRSDAISANLMSISNQQLFDVAGRTQSPYQTQTLFAAAPSVNYSKTAVTKFVFDNTLIFKNTGNISGVSVDFADGLGYRTVTLGTVISISYSTIGVKRIKVKLTPTVGTVVESWFDFTVNVVSCTNCRYFASNSIPLTDPTFLPSSNHSGGTVSVVLSVNNLTGRIRKPLIVAEGFDPFSISPGLSGGDYTINDFIRQLPLTPFNFNTNLDNTASYDLIFINYNNGTDDLKRNALLLQAVIRKVNAEKALGGSTQQNVVMGLSMGGLVARFGLAQMVRNGENTQTRLLITHDSPHRGANVPLAFQFMGRQITNLGSINIGSAINIHPTDIITPARELRDLLDATATSQLLITRATGANSTVANTFLANGGEYRTMVDNLTTPYQTIATSDGSQCATPLFAPGSVLVNGDVGGYLGFKNIVNAGLRTSIVLTSSVSNSLAEVSNWRVYAQIRIFTIPINITLYRFIAGGNGATSFDGVSGGTYATIDNSSYKTSAWLPFGVSSEFSGTGEFCFVPTGSALDVANFNSSASERYVNSVNISNPSKFTRYIAQEQFIRTTAGVNSTVFNQRHIEFTERNSRWLFDQMEIPTSTINQECSGECTSSGLAMTGNNLVCTTESYSVNSTVGTPVTWSVLPVGFVTLATNGSAATLTRTTIGNVTLTARVGNCIILTKVIQVGVPIPNFAIIETTQPCPIPIRGEYTVSPISPNTTYSWVCTGCGTGNVTATGTQGEFGTITLPRTPVGRTFSLAVTATNTCGGGSLVVNNPFTAGTNCNALRIAISPNPTTQSRVSLNVVDDDTNKSGVVDNSYQVTIADSFGNIKFDKKFTTSDNDINVSSFNVGTYSIRVIKGQGVVTKTFSVMR